MDINAIKNGFNVWGKPADGSFAKYGNGAAVADYLDINLDLISDAAHRGLLKNQVHCMYQQFAHAQTGSILQDLRLLGAVRYATDAYTVGHKVQDRLEKTFTTTGAAAGTAGAAVVWTLPSAFSHGGKIEVDIDTQIRIEGTDTRVVVVGIDNGGTLNKYGVDATGTPITSGSLGGTPTAHVIVVRPIHATDIVPAVTSSTRMYAETQLREDGSCPNNYYVAGLPTDMRFGFSQIRSDYKETSNMSATGLSCEFMDGNSKYRVLSDTAQAYFHMHHICKVRNSIWFDQRYTNVPIGGLEKKQNNGVYTQILANDGIVQPHVAGTYTFGDLKNLMAQLKERGVYEAVIYAGTKLWQNIMDTIQSSGNPFWSNVNINIDNNYSLREGICLNATMNCFEYGGVKLYFRDHAVWSDAHAGLNYANVGIVIPMGITQMTDLGGTSQKCNRVNVWFKRDNMGRVFDENYSWSYGGAAKTPTSGCDFKADVYKTELAVQLVGTEQFAAITTI